MTMTRIGSEGSETPDHLVKSFPLWLTASGGNAFPRPLTKEFPLVARCLCPVLGVNPRNPRHRFQIRVRSCCCGIVPTSMPGAEEAVAVFH
jgi:hypothetical protein